MSYRVAHPFRSHRKGWVIERSETAFLRPAGCPMFATVSSSLTWGWEAHTNLNRVPRPGPHHRRYRPILRLHPRRVPHISILRCGHRPKDDRFPHSTASISTEAIIRACTKPRLLLLVLLPIVPKENSSPTPPNLSPSG